MSLRKIAGGVIAGAMMASVAAGVVAQDVVADPAIAAMSVEEVVAAREDMMRQSGGLLRGLGRGTPAETAEQAAALVQNFTNLQVMFPEGSAIGDSRALPLIWAEKEAFEAIFARAAELSAAIGVAAEAGDAATIGANAQQLGGLCSECHTRYRS